MATQAGRDAVAYASSHCATDDISNFAFKKLQTQTYSTLGDKILFDPVVRSVLVQNTIGLYKNETPTAPVYIYHSNTDQSPCQGPTRPTDVRSHSDRRRDGPRQPLVRLRHQVARLSDRRVRDGARGRRS